MTPVEALIAAWLAWDQAPGAPWTAAGKVDALRAAGLSVTTAHERIAEHRRRGWDVPSAVEATVLDLTHHQEAA